MFWPTNEKKKPCMAMVAGADPDQNWIPPTANNENATDFVRPIIAKMRWSVNKKNHGHGYWSWPRLDSLLIHIDYKNHGVTVQPSDGINWMSIPLTFG